MKNNIIYNFVYQLLLAILPIITAPYISRIFGPELQGVYSYTFSIVNYFSLFIMLGLKNYGNRAIAQTRNNKEQLSKTFFEIYILQSVCFLITLIVYLGYILTVSSKYTTISLLQVIVLFSYLFDISWFFYGIEQFKFTIFRNTIIKVITVGFIFLFVKSSEDFYVYILIMSLSMLISSLSLWSVLFKKVIVHKVTLNGILKHLKPNLLLFIPVIGVSIYKLLSKILLGSMGSMYDLGLFENADKIVMIITGLITSVGAVMLPRLSNMAVNGETEKIKKITHRTLNITFLLSLGISAGLFCVSSTFPLWFFGEKFKELKYVLPFLGLTIPFVAWASVLRTQYLIPLEKDKDYIVSIMLGAGVNLLSNVVLITYFGIYGSLTATLLTEFFVCAYQTYAVRKYLPVKEYIKNNSIFLIPAVLMVAIVKGISGFLPDDLFIKMAGQVFIGLISYILMAGGLLIFAKGKFMSEEYQLVTVFASKYKKKLKRK